jgi:hypothetical protein
LTLNFSVKAYARKDLETFKTNVAIVETVLSLPFILSNKPSVELLQIPYPATLVKGWVSCALEADNSYISCIKALIIILKLCANPEFSRTVGISHPKYLILRNILVSILHVIIMKTYPEQKHRTKRRVFRAAIFAFIDSFFFSNSNSYNNQYLREGELIAVFLGRFCGKLIVNGINEYIGEKIIQGADDADCGESSDECAKEKFYRFKRFEREAQ